MFCLKLETAYEVRISDWSSDVCSSDLQPFAAQHRVAPGAPTRTGRGSRAMANAGADKPARIFRDYDQAALDRELNLRGRWPEHGRYFERSARDSAAGRERLPARLGLADRGTPAAAAAPLPAPGTT